MPKARIAFRLKMGIIVEEVRNMKRFVLFALILCMLLCFAACESSGRHETAVPTETKPQGDSAAEYYAELVRDFKKLIEFRLSAQFDDSWYENLQNVELSDTYRKIEAGLGEREYGWSSMMIELTNPETSFGAENFGYVLYDLDADGQLELFWVRSDHSPVAAFTYKNGEVILLDAWWSRYSGFISQDGKLYSWGSGGAADNRCTVYALTAEGVLEETYAFSGESDWENGTVNYFEWTEGTKTAISAQRYEELTASYPYEQSDLWLRQLVMPLK